MPVREKHPLILAVALGIIGVLLVACGVTIPFGIIFGTALVIWGCGTILMGFIYGWRGGRLGVFLVGRELVIRHYFSETRTEITRIRRIYRGVDDATILETADGKVVIDDTYFESKSVRIEFCDALSQLTG